MKKIGEVLRSGDWKNEKHVPIINAPAKVESGVTFSATVVIGSDDPHPNTTEHHIRWIKLLFQPEDGFTYELADFQFTAHGESVKGANAGPAYTKPRASIDLKLNTSGTLMALSYCNIHGLWENSVEIQVK